MNMRNQTKGRLLRKFLLNTSRNSSKSEDFALFLNMIWNAAGQAPRCRRQNEREKSKTSPNLRVGLPQFRPGSLREQYFKRLNLVSTRSRSDSECAARPLAAHPDPFCFGIFLTATRSRTARRNFSRSAGLSMSSLRFIASATVLA